jgi:signal transduction histidine kinase
MWISLKKTQRHPTPRRLEATANRQGVTLQLFSEGQPREIECDPEQIKQLLLNLILNAMQAIDGEGTVVVRTLFTDDSVCVDRPLGGHCWPRFYFPAGISNSSIKIYI